MLTIKDLRGFIFSSICLMLSSGTLSAATAASNEQTAVFAGGCFWGCGCCFQAR